MGNDSEQTVVTLMETSRTLELFYPEYCTSLVGSMLNSIKAVIATKGDVTC